MAKGIIIHPQVASPYARASSNLFSPSISQKLSLNLSHLSPAHLSYPPFGFFSRVSFYENLGMVHWLIPALNLSYILRLLLTYPQCLKIAQKVAFHIASEASYVYILSGEKFIKNTKIGQFWRVFENLKFAVKHCYQTGQF